MRKVSVLIRARNEATFLEATLRAVRAQRLALPVEVVCADNGSTDGSEDIAKEWADTVITIGNYRPGTALNRLCELATGDVLVPLSAHAVPANDRWLATLVAHLGNPRVLGVYGAQHYPSTSRFLDKRDLDIFSDPRPRSEFRDSDFWNANSASSEARGPNSRLTRKRLSSKITSGLSACWLMRAIADSFASSRPLTYTTMVIHLGTTAPSSRLERSRLASASIRRSQSFHPPARTGPAS